MLLCGVAHLLRGENDRADERFAQADEVAAGVGAVDVRRLALAERSLLAESAGDRSRARELAAAVGRLVGERDSPHYAPGAIELAAIARAELRHGDWHAARAALDGAQALVPVLTHALPWCSVQALIELARAYIALLDTSTAAKLLDRAGVILQQRPALGVLSSETETLVRGACPRYASTASDGRRC